MNTKLEVIRIHSELNAKLGFETTLIFKSTADLFDIWFEQADFFCAANPQTPSKSYICLNDEMFNTTSLKLLVNIICHEFGHLLDAKAQGDYDTPRTLEGVIAHEERANIYGVELFAEYFPREEYYHNHLDQARMARSLKGYLGESVKGTQLQGVE